MRIAITFRANRIAGGIETYLDWLLPALRSAGHRVAFLFERDEPRDYPEIAAASGAEMLCASELGRDRAIEALKRWRPDLFFNNGLSDLELEKALLADFRGVLYLHGFFGACISGNKATRVPVRRPCHRPFGAKCLLHYFPRRCGGLNPLTMVALYRRESARLAILRRYDALVAASKYLRAEYLAMGFAADSTYAVYPFVCPDSDSGEPVSGRSAPHPQDGGKAGLLRLLFAGRMEPVKGADLLLAALPRVLEMLGRPLRLTMAGDGRSRAALERQARSLMSRYPMLQVEFAGWLERAALERLMDGCDLLVIPSWWPETFCLVGLEAGARGLPVAAFGVGAIPEWLSDGVNGCVADAEPPTYDGLARAIVRCVRDPGEHRRLRSGAIEVARSFTAERHLTALLEVFSLATDSAHASIDRERWPSLNPQSSLD